MADNASLDKKLNDVLERLQYLQMVISNLKYREGSLITDVGEIDERLFKEIANYEMSTEELKKDFVLLLLEDARKLSDMCIVNIGRSKKTLEQFDKIGSVMDFIFNHESRDIENSKELQDFVIEARDKLKEIANGMKSKIKGKEDEDREYKKTWSRHSKLEFA